MKNSGLIRFLFFGCTAVILTWPLGRHLSTHLPLGTETAATVPLFNLWTLMWNAQKLAHGYAGYWNAPIFYPEPGTFALSDPQPLTGMIFALPYFLFGNPVLAYNLVFLGFLTMNGVAGTSPPAPLLKAGEGGGHHPLPLSPKRKRGEGGMWVVGLLAQSLPFVTREWGVLQLVAVFPVIYALRAVRQFGETPTLRAGLSLGAWVAVTILTSSYYGLFLMLVLPLGMVFARKEHFQRKAILNLLAGALLAGAVLWPVLAAQVRLTEGYARRESTIQRNSAWGVDYLRLDGRMWGEGVMPWLQSRGGSGQRLYPGTGLLLLAGIGVVLGWRRSRREVVFGLLGVGLAMGISFGLNLEVAGVRPYEWVREFVPGFAQLRSPFRMGMMVQVFLVGLAALGGMGKLQDKRWELPRTLRLRKAHVQGTTFFILVGLVSILEVVALPVQVWETSEVVNSPEWVEWLAGQPAGAVALIPFPEGGSVEAFEPTVMGMVLSLSYGKPLVNGYSGFFPLSYEDLSEVMARQFPNENSLARLREAGVRYLLVEKGWLTTEDEATLFSLGVEAGWEWEELVVFVVR